MARDWTKAFPTGTKIVVESVGARGSKFTHGVVVDSQVIGGRRELIYLVPGDKYVSRVARAEHVKKA